MAYVRAARVRHLDFEEGSDFPGLEIRIGGMSVDEYQEVRTNQAMIALFVDRLVSWTMIDEDGDPVPATAEGVDSCDVGDVLTLVDIWFRECPRVRRPPAPAPTAAVPVQGPVGDESGLSPQEGGPSPDPEFEAEIPMQL
ncbi:MAG: hypothetical protein GY925_16890, partial [Actinomycetia bacterium]|nr:hypothetical protein [Actinomycetes bacterium]